MTAPLSVIAGRITTIGPTFLVLGAATLIDIPAGWSAEFQEGQGITATVYKVDGKYVAKQLVIHSK